MGSLVRLLMISDFGLIRLKYNRTLCILLFLWGSTGGFSLAGFFITRKVVGRLSSSPLLLDGHVTVHPLVCSLFFMSFPQGKLSHCISSSFRHLLGLFKRALAHFCGADWLDFRFTEVVIPYSSCYLASWCDQNPKAGCPDIIRSRHSLEDCG